MKKSKSDWVSLLAKFEIQGGSVNPVQRKILAQYQKNTGFMLPKSYCDYCQVFGPGFLTLPYCFRVCVPTASSAAFDIDILNKNKKGMPEDYVSDVDQFRRAVFFASDIGTSHFFWDPHEVIDSKNHEYGIFVIYRSWEVKRISEDFSSLIHDICHGSGVPGYENAEGVDLVFEPGQ
ncbi:hypothetical protein [Zavarzinella formosa]|uniref:hypothetical protein n=1 Tax=Zavarzinella formosa TaxID=360055 RepID=UPI000364C234|nr:hypothetical protein [Zavarzinella formosa]